MIQIAVLDPELGPEGWFFSGRNGSDQKDPVYGYKLLKELYLKADPHYEGRYTVPTLWDKKKETIVNNESSEIIRMLYSEFDELLPEAFREVNRPGGGLYPEHLRGEIDEMNSWVYPLINNGVYKTGFATTQAAYEENIYPLFEALDRVEAHLGQPEHQPFLFGECISEADIRLYTTISRFDVAYYLIFKCNLKMIRHDYPRIDRWYRRLYYDESELTRGAFKKTTYFDVVSALALNRDFQKLTICSTNLDTLLRLAGRLVMINWWFQLALFPISCLQKKSRNSMFWGPSYPGLTIKWTINFHECSHPKSRHHSSHKRGRNP